VEEKQFNAEVLVTQYRRLANVFIEQRAVTWDKADLEGSAAIVTRD